MTSEGLGEIFEGDPADTCGRKIPLVSMGVSLPVPHSAQPPIGTSGNFPARVSAESPSNISPNPSEVISEVSELYDKPFMDIFDVSQFSGQNRVNWGGSGGPRFFLIGIFPFVLLGSPCKNL